ncbi:MAG: rhomboid family intramembrane serine protease [bacterium]|nr:rhomboid family intramembrane serine protease [bacterium]
MFLPISDMPNPRGTPFVNYLLIGINVAVYLLISFPLSSAPVNPNDPALLEYIRAIPQYANVPLQDLLRQVSAYDLFVFSHGFKPGMPSVNDLFFSMFLHGGFMHLFGNMLFLWIYGDNVEHRLGSVKYLVAYLATGVTATLFFTVFRLNSIIPMVGASGAISGVLGLYFLWFPKNQVRVFIMLFPIFMDTVLLNARLVLGIYLVIDNIIPFLFASGAGGGVAHGAHIGGFLGGLAIAYGTDRLPELFSLPKWRTAWSSDAKEPSLKQKGTDTASQIHDALKKGDLGGAVSAYFSAHSGERKNILPADRLQIGYQLLKKGHYAEAVSVFRHYIGDYHNGPDLDKAYLGAGVALYQGLGQLTSAYQYFLAVLDVDADPETAAQARRYIAAIKDMQKLQMGRRR